MRGTTQRAARLVTALVASCVAVALLALPAAADELEREAYVERVEPICKRNTEANRRIFKGAKGKVQRGELRAASRHFKRAARAFGRTVRQIEAVPRPPADAAKLGRWLALLRAERRYVARIGSALAAGRKRRAEAISVRLDRNSTRANNTVIGFGFKFCRIEPTRFGAAG